MVRIKKKKKRGEISEKLLRNLIEENEEVCIVRDIARLRNLTVRVPIPFNIDKINDYMR